MSDDVVRVCALRVSAFRVSAFPVNAPRVLAAALAILAAGSFGFAEKAHAQDVRLPMGSAGPQTVSGVVVNEQGSPLADIDVFIEQLQRRTRSGTTGRFLFAGVKEGKYTVSARSIGYQAISTKITVKDSGAVVRLAIKRTAFSLPSRITTASRGGLSGIIADTGFRAMPGVRVRVSGQTVDVLTDEAGQFFAPLKPGKYLVRLERQGFARQLIGVTVPVDSGRQLAAWMVPQKGRDNPQEGANLFDMNVRMLRGRPASYFTFTQEDIKNTPHTDLRGFLSAVEGRRVNQSCMVLINGGPRREPMWKLSLGEIEFLEDSLLQPERQRVHPGPPGDLLSDKSPMVAASDDSCSGITVWLRR